MRRKREIKEALPGTVAENSNVERSKGRGKEVADEKRGIGSENLSCRTTSAEKLSGPMSTDDTKPSDSPVSEKKDRGKRKSKNVLNGTVIEAAKVKQNKGRGKESTDEKNNIGSEDLLCSTTSADYEKHRDQFQ